MLVETLLRNALDRGRLGRYRRSEAFESAVAEALIEARLQPFGSPLATARTYAANTWLSAEQRCVWDEAASRISQGALSEIERPCFTVLESETLGHELSPTPKPPPPVFRSYVVHIRTDVGPGSPAAVLRDLATGGAAKVEVECDPSGDPRLVYEVEASLHAELLAELSAEPEMPARIAAE